MGVLDYDPFGTPERSAEEMNTWDSGRGIRARNFGSLVEAFGAAAMVVASCEEERGSWGTQPGCGRGQWDCGAQQAELGGYTEDALMKK